jgi:hypothetical protein
MKSKIQILFCLVAIAFISTSCFNGNKQNIQSSLAESTEPAFEVNREFLQAYLGGNKIAADEKYKDKRFIVKGIVSKIDNIYEPIVKVETEVGEVDCVFDKSQTSVLAKLSLAQNVEIDCTFKGIIMSARFENCKLK